MANLTRCVTLGVFLIPGVFLGCPPPSGPVVPPPNPPVDTDWCGKMCDHLEGLGCEEGKPVYNNDLPGPPDVPNQSCKDHCEELQNRGFFVNPRCVAQVKTCEEIEPSRQKDCTPPAPAPES